MLWWRNCLLWWRKRVRVHARASERDGRRQTEIAAASETVDQLWVLNLQPPTLNCQPFTLKPRPSNLALNPRPVVLGQAFSAPSTWTSMARSPTLRFLFVDVVIPLLPIPISHRQQTLLHTPCALHPAPCTLHAAHYTTPRPATNVLRLTPLQPTLRFSTGCDGCRFSPPFIWPKMISSQYSDRA